jgi:hypothetical protein
MLQTSRSYGRWRHQGLRLLDAHANAKCRKLDSCWKAKQFHCVAFCMSQSATGWFNKTAVCVMDVNNSEAVNTSQPLPLRYVHWVEQTHRKLFLCWRMRMRRWHGMVRRGFRAYRGSYDLPSYVAIFVGAESPGKVEYSVKLASCIRC